MSIKRTSTNSRQPVSWDKPHLALVEGKDDQDFVCSQILITSSSPESWQIHDTEGVGASKSDIIKNILMDRHFSEVGSSIALVQDADSDPLAAASSLQYAFKANSLPVPTAHGLVESTERIKTGFYIFPDGKSKGELEDLLMDSIPDQERKELSRSFVENFPTHFDSILKPSKNMLQTYLATHSKFVKWIDVAIQRTDVIPANSPVFQEFRTFLSNLES